MGTSIIGGRKITVYFDGEILYEDVRVPEGTDICKNMMNLI